VSDTILVVDDSITILELLTEALEPEGFRTLKATDGEDAFAKLLSCKEIVLVMCDVNMPRMSGLDLLASAHGRGLEVPFLMLTTEAQSELMERAKSLGAKGWMVKPVKPPLLVQAVKSIIAKSRMKPTSRRPSVRVTGRP
jgi:two-component system chemotaxis response regulator CheY